MLCIIYWIEFYSVDSVIHPLNNCGRTVTLSFAGQAQRERKGQCVQRKLCPSGFCYWASQRFLFLTCPTGKCCFLGKFKLQKDCNQSSKSKRVLGLVEMNCGIVHASYSLPEWQAVKLTFFVP